MARVNWQGTEIQAELIEELPDGRYRMRSLSKAPRIEPGTVIDVEQSQIVGLNIGSATFLGPGAAPAPTTAAVAGAYTVPPIILTKADVLPLAAALQSATTSTSVIPQGQNAANPLPPQDSAQGTMTVPGPAAIADLSPLLRVPGGVLRVSQPAAPQPQGNTVGTPLVEIKGLGNAITSVRSGLAGVRALAADVQVSAGALHAELTDMKQQIEDARTQIKTEASIMGNSGGCRERLMAYVQCPTCDRVYDDAQRWTFCPHNRLEASPWGDGRGEHGMGYCEEHDLFNCQFDHQPRFVPGGRP